MPDKDHLQMIQGAIERLAGNSFTIKGWSLSVVAAVLALAAAKESGEHAGAVALVSILPIVFFWYLDAYYLSLERRYRALYDAVRTGTAVPAYSMDTSTVAAESPLRIAIGRPAVVLFHLALLVAAIAAAWLLA